MTTPDTYRPAHQIALVRPGPASLRWFREAVRACQAGDPLAPVTVVVPSPYVGLHVRRALAEVGCANVRLVVQLRQIAERLARAGRVPGTERPLTKAEHFRRYMGRQVRVRTREAIEGQRSFTGTLTQNTGTGMHLRCSRTVFAEGTGAARNTIGLTLCE